MERGRVLRIFNTLTGRKDPFEPLVPGQVRMYVCGVTVYDDVHLGHARSAVVFDVIRRYLEYRGFDVIFIKNFTDVDDKIINRANQLGLPWQEVTTKYIDAYYRDMGRLGVRPATVEPKATEHMAEIIRLIHVLLEQGVAYRVNGDVYFEVQKYPAYGRLSKRKLDELQAGARVDVDERKRNPMDFALWKSSKPGEPAWPSPWGSGRPGWHIECSAMSMKHLGDTFDIHGGGQDLIFPHHENEIAQSCAATGKEFARYWIHNGFVTVDSEKMSKSLGNFFTVWEIFEKFLLSDKKKIEVIKEVVRFFLLSTHYRSPIDFSDVALLQSWAGLDNFYNLFFRLEDKADSQGSDDKDAQRLLTDFSAVFERAMDDDFNTAVVIADFQRLRSELNSMMQGLGQETRTRVRESFRRFGEVLGLFQVAVNQWEFGVPTGWMDRGTQTSLPPQPKREHPAHGVSITEPPLPLIEEEREIQRKVDERNEARQRKDFKRADEIRKELWERYHVTLEDRPDGTTRWKR
jgi:cysteinyl-tRNA synthetase